MWINRKIKLILAFLAFFSGVSAAECTPETAANYYADKSYHEAMACYEELLRTGESPELYYNYANSCYKSGHLGLAILNYEKALKINPFYDDAKFNLALVNQQITDKIDPVETFFLVSWLENLGKLFSSNQWAYLGLFCFFIFLAMVLVFLFSSWRWLRKTAFWTGFFMLILFITCVSYSYIERNKQIQTPEAIVLAGSLVVRSAPDESGTELFVLHEGSKLKVKDELGDWCEIVVADGNSGWIKKSLIGKI